MLSLSVGMLFYFLIFFFPIITLYEIWPQYFSVAYFYVIFFPELLEGGLVQTAILTLQNNIFYCFCIVFNNTVACFPNTPGLCYIYTSFPGSFSLVWTPNLKGVLVGLVVGFTEYCASATLHLQ